MNKNVKWANRYLKAHRNPKKLPGRHMDEWLEKNPPPFEAAATEIVLAKLADQPLYQDKPMIWHLYYGNVVHDLAIAYSLGYTLKRKS